MIYKIKGTLTSALFVVAVLLVLSLVVLTPMLSMIVLAAVFAYVVRPIARKLQPFLRFQSLAILVAKWQATKEELAAWVFLGPEQGGLAAFLDAYQITPPRQFFYPYCAGCEDYLWPLSLWWFRQNDIEQFVPADR